MAAQIEDVLLLAAERREVVLAENPDLHESPTRTKVNPRWFSSRMMAGSAASIGATSGCASWPRPSWRSSTMPDRANRVARRTSTPADGRSVSHTPRLHAHSVKEWRRATSNTPTDL